MHGATRVFVHETAPGAQRLFYLTGLLGGLHETQALQSGIRVTNQHLSQSWRKSFKNTDLVCRRDFWMLTDFLYSKLAI